MKSILNWIINKIIIIKESSHAIIKSERAQPRKGIKKLINKFLSCLRWRLGIKKI